MITVFKLLTRPKITIFLKSGNVIRTRVWPSFPHAVLPADLMNRLVTQEMSDICAEANRECVSIRAWWQSWA